MKALLVRFGSPEALVRAVKALQEAGCTRLDAFTPFPLPDLLERLGPPTARIGWTAALAALAGGLLTYATVYWTSVVDYPLNVGGRPLHSWPAFLPVAIVAAALWSGIATLLAMLWWCGLPRWHHPLFQAREFDRATWDKFFLAVACDDPACGEARARELIRGCGPEAVKEVEL